MQNPEQDKSQRPRSLKSFTASTARPLPVIVLADTSGSMTVDGKIDALNTALSEMVSSFGEEEAGRAEIHVSVIVFGGKDARLHLPLAPASGLSIEPLVASGMTPLGAALDLATSMIEDREKVPGRAYTPALVLVSDGQPNDEWEPALARLLNSPRASKAQRFALGIGEDADAQVLRKFLADPEGKVCGANEARQIKAFFRWVTMSVTSRSRSTTPNASVAIELGDYDLDELL